MTVSKMAQNLIGSEIIKVAGEVNSMIARGEQICNLTIGDFDPSIYPIPQELKEGITQAYNQGHTNYPPANGVAELRKAVTEFTADKLGLQYPENDILVAGIFYVLRFGTLLQNGVVGAGAPPKKLFHLYFLYRLKLIQGQPSKLRRNLLIFILLVTEM